MYQNCEIFGKLYLNDKIAVFISLYVLIIDIFHIVNNDILSRFCENIKSCSFSELVTLFELGI